MRHIQKESTGSVSHVRSALTREPEADVVLREQNVADALPVVRLVFANPEDFCKSEVWQRRVAGELNQPLQAESFREIAALFFGAHVAPDECGTNDASVFVQKNGPVHLAGKADAGYILAVEIRARKRFANGKAGCPPPVVRMLLGPADLR
jgi:hypothetical protein